MAYRAFDTETSDLIPRGENMTNDLTKLPHALQISAAIYDPDTKEFSFTNDYIKIDESVKIHEKAFETHHLDHEFLKKNGVGIDNVLMKFEDDNTKVKTNIAHNFDFDKQMLSIEASRIGMDNMFLPNQRHVCTMKKYKRMCNVKTKNDKGEEYVKYPRLSELFKKVFPDDILPDNMHNSLIDTLVCLRCYLKVELDMDIYEENHDFRILYDSFMISSGVELSCKATNDVYISTM